MEIIQERLEREYQPRPHHHGSRTSSIRSPRPTARSVDVLQSARITPTRRRSRRRASRIVKASIIDAARSMSATIMPTVPGPPRRSSRICSTSTQIVRRAALRNADSTRSSTTFSTRSRHAPRAMRRSTMNLSAIARATSSSSICCSTARSGRRAVASFVHRDKAYARARKICEKLKENIPRQLFEVPDSGGHRRQGHRPRDRQGAAQGRSRQVLRRRYHPKEEAARKAEGRQKDVCARSARCQMPTEAFMAVLKLDEES